MWYRAGADLVVAVHLLFIGFFVGGVFLTWRWPVVIWAHVPAVGYGALTHGVQIGLGVLLLLVVVVGYWGFLRQHGRGVGIN